MGLLRGLRSTEGECQALRTENVTVSVSEQHWLTSGRPFAEGDLGRFDAHWEGDSLVVRE